jgi:signal transduction histidine kinase
VGFDLATEGTAGQGFGLLGMRERAALVGASLQIESAAGKGTTILVRMAAAGAATSQAAGHA